jgi:Fusaric acid resistance protein-like
VTLRDDVRDLFTFRDSPVRRPIAVAAGLAIGLPIAVLTLLGQPQLGLIASTGGFTALYFGNRPRRERAALLPFIVLGLVAAGAIGVAEAWSTALSLVALFLLTVVGSIILLGFGAGPPGGLFFMLVAGASIRLTAPPRLGGVGLNGGLVIGMVAIGAVIAYVIVISPLVVPSVRRRDFEAHATRQRFHFDLSGDIRVIIIRLTVASAIAVLVSSPLGVHRTYWVLLTVIAIMQNGRRLRLTALRGIHRVLGTFVGLGLFALLLSWNPHGLLLALLLAVLQFIVELVVIRNYGLALIFITPLALIIAAQGDPGDVGTVISTRVVDTLLGAGIALVVLLGALLLRSYLPGMYRRIEG